MHTHQELLGFVGRRQMNLRLRRFGGNTAGSHFGIQYTIIHCGASISFAVTQGKFTGEYAASL